MTVINQGLPVQPSQSYRTLSQKMGKKITSIIITQVKVKLIPSVPIPNRTLLVESHSYQRSNYFPEPGQMKVDPFCLASSMIAINLPAIFGWEKAVFVS